jgi:hypothetical protein
MQPKNLHAREPADRISTHNAPATFNRIVERR